MQHPLRNALLNGNLDLAKHIVKKYGIEVKGTTKVNSDCSIGSARTGVAVNGIILCYACRRMH